MSYSRLSNNKSISEQLKDYQLRQSSVNEGTNTFPLDLLTHASGINRANFKVLNTEFSPSTLELLQGSERLESKKIHHFQTPRKSYLYSEGAFVLARALIEQCSGSDLSQYWSNELNSVLENELILGASPTRAVQGYRNSTLAVQSSLFYPNYSGYGAWISSSDYAKFLVKIIDKQSFIKEFDLKSSYYDLLFTPVMHIKNTKYSSCAVFEKNEFKSEVFRLCSRRDGFRSYAYLVLTNEEGLVLLMCSEMDYFFSEKKDKLEKKLNKIFKKHGLFEQIEL